MEKTIHAVVHTDSISSGSGDTSSAHLTEQEAIRAGAQLVRELWPVYSDGENAPDNLSDLDLIEALQDFEDVSIEIEAIKIGPDVVAALARQLPAPAADLQSGPKVFRMLDLHISHLTYDNSDYLNRTDGVIATRREYGWLLHVPTDDAEDRIAEYEIPADVAAIWRYAIAHDCSYVLIDQDADVADGLPTYTW